MDFMSRRLHKLNGSASDIERGRREGKKEGKNNGKGNEMRGGGRVRVMEDRVGKERKTKTGSEGESCQ